MRLIHSDWDTNFKCLNRPKVLLQNNKNFKPTIPPHENVNLIWQWHGFSLPGPAAAFTFTYLLIGFLILKRKTFQMQAKNTAFCLRILLR